MGAMARLVDRNAKREQIVAAAAGQFAKTGFAATLMDDVATAACVSKGSLYDYFENKEDLFYAVFEWSQRQVMLASLAEFKTGLTAKEQILNFAEAAATALVAQVELYPVTLEVWSAAATADTRKRFAEAMRQLYAQFRGQVEALLRAAQQGGEIKPDTDTRAIASMLVGAVDGLMLQYWLDPNFDPKAWVRTFLCALFDGIAAGKTKE